MGGRRWEPARRRRRTPADSTEGEAKPRTTLLARRCDAEGGGCAANGARVEEGPTGEIPARLMERPARHGGVLAKYGRRRGLAGQEDGFPVPGEVVATSAGAQETRQRRPEAEQWRQRHCCRRGCTSGGLHGKRRAGRRRGGTCEAEEDGGAASRRTGAAARAAGSGRRHGREKEDGGEKWCGRGGAREEAKRGQEREEIPFYRSQRGAGHGKGGDGAGNPAGGHECRSREGINPRQLGTGFKGKN
uniref:OSJNBb0112E13.9 protein n=2 Tax=Oryza sativa subsp. japonica TaxID=39947 RepID=Q7X651_ORYSJ|nr:OSJNBb0112E13.9 [Oryza sativa Japonica Group]CAE05798.1 OSJNBb0046K02.8 [Oryza sativa Japonica Group]